ncbi:hypothetical protein FRB91_001612 [Serendipita sp. 411]|nr:hypothetical protein FRC19_006661 [Serendipita sp. 401]KAG8837878.1 hypothetical protein FRC18_007461 [Serendipita sp. 400]KAG8855888.1 hypothetical protein FRB91_001612 [Serendipita sp. 411]
MPATRSSTSNNHPSSTTCAQSSSVSSPDVIPKCASPSDFFPSIKSESSMIDVKEALLRKKRRTLNWEKDERVPRPRNAFIAFKASLRDGPLQREYTARLARGENIGVVAQQLWRGLTEKERDVWYAAARKEKEDHAKKYPDYKYQPRVRPRKTRKSKKRSGKQTDDDGDDGDESSEEDSFDQNASHKQDREQYQSEGILTSGSPCSGSSENDQTDSKGEVRTVEIYMGGSQDLDTLYKNGWKWALVKDHDPSTDTNNPIVPTAIDRDDDDITNVELVSMASALENAEAEAEAAAQSKLNICSTTESLLLDMFNPWESEPISNISTNLFVDEMKEDEPPEYSEIVKVQPAD